jgi:hypothetical protein
MNKMLTRILILIICFSFFQKVAHSKVDYSDSRCQEYFHNYTNRVQDYFIKENINNAVFQVFTGDIAYIGNIKHSLRNGKGVMIWPSGEYYEGSFKKNRRNGFGVMLWPNGQYYEGSFKEDLRHGFGIMKFPDGSTYKGLWKN